MDTLFRVLVTYKSTIIRWWKVFYFLVIAFLFVAGRSIWLQDEHVAFFYQLGVWSGKVALMLLIVTLIPGMTKRFGVQHKLIAIIRIFRRYIGISVFLFAMTHSTIVRWIYIFSGVMSLPRPLFEMLGTIAFLLLLCMFLTSNDWSVNRLGIWWYRLHWLTYGIMWLIFFHVAIQRWSIWSVIMGIVVVLQMASFGVSYLKRKKT